MPEVIKIRVVVLERVERFFEFRLVATVEVLTFRKNPSVRHAAVFDEQNRRVRAFFPQNLQKRKRSFGDEFRTHVRKRVDHVNFRVDFRHQFRDRRFHPRRPGEAEVDDRIVDSAAQNRRVRHPRTRRATAVRDRGAVINDRLFVGSRRKRRKLRAFRNADRERVDAVVQREINQVIAFFSFHSGNPGFRRFLFRRLRAGDPKPTFRNVVERVKVEPGNAGRRHVRHRDGTGIEVVTHLDFGRVGAETNDFPRRMLRQIPNGAGNLLLSAAREAREITVDVVPTLVFDRPLGRVEPSDAVLDGRLHVDRLLGAKARNARRRDDRRE